MGNEQDRAIPGADNVLTLARDSAGRFARPGETEAPVTAARREYRQRATKERDYLRAIVAKIGKQDLVGVASRIVADAKGGADVDVKVVNAARDWLGKYLLGNARVALDDCDDMPAIVKRR